MTATNPMPIESTNGIGERGNAPHGPFIRLPVTKAGDGNDRTEGNLW
jgi:hypothetical protein